MAVTRLKRKGLRNKLKAQKRQEKIKDLTHMPPIKNVDVEKIKAEFAKKSGKKPAKEKAAKEEKVQPEAEQEDTTAIAKEPAKAQVKDTKKAEDTSEEKK